MDVITRQPIDRQMLPRLDRQQQALFDLSTMWRHYEGDLERSIREITETASRALNIERVSVWQYDRVQRTIKCMDLFEAVPQRHSSGMELSAEGFPAYFAALESEEVIAAEDARSDPRTFEFAQAYLKPNGIGAMLDSPVRAGGELAGVLCHEHIGGPRTFHVFEINASTYLANMVSAAFSFQRRLQGEFGARRSLSLLRAAFEACGAALLAINEEGRIHECNQQAIDLWKLPLNMINNGTGPNEVLRHMAAQTTDPDAFSSRMQAAFGSKDEESRDIAELPDGRIIECKSQPQLIGEYVIGRVWSFRDITEQHRLEERLRELSMRDPLTGLFNRRRVDEAIRMEIARSGRNGKPFCVALLDLDHFKAVNDTHGHEVGDEVLRAVACDLQERLRATDHVGRWGGEEFVLVLHDTTLQTGMQVLEELRSHVGRDRESLPQVTFSAGIAEYRDGLTAEKLIAEADERMYQAKDGGRNRVAA